MSFRNYYLPDLLKIVSATKQLKKDKKLDIIVFCDPGLDDALMLINLLSSAKHNVLGIVPGAGNVSLATTTNNALRICELVERKDIKVYPGCQHPINRTEADMINGVSVHGNDGLAGVYLPNVDQMQAETRDGVDFAVEQIIKSHVLLVSTGGLTDIYRVLKRLEQENPKALDNIVGISMMGGVINAEQEANAPLNAQPFTEFNILFDPIASKGVFDIANKYQIQIFLAPLDLTHSLLCHAEDVDALNKVKHPVVEFASALINAVPEFYKKKFGKGPNGEYRQPLHDVHSSMCLLHPELYSTNPAYISVLDEGKNAGRMIVNVHEDGNVHLLSIHYSHRKRFYNALIKDLCSYQLDFSADQVSVSALTARAKQAKQNSVVSSTTCQIIERPGC